MPKTIKPGAVLEAALGLAALGVPVHPLKPNSKLPASLHGLKDATTDPAQIRRMFTNGHNIGLVWPSLVLDCDDPARVPELEATYAELAAAPAVDTPRGGRHWYLRSDWRMPTRAAAAPGLDIRGFGRAYTVGPASTVDGIAYTLVRPFTAPQDAPQASAELRAYLNPTPKAANAPRPAQRPTASAAAPTPDGAKTIEGNPARYAEGLLANVRSRLGATANNRNEACYAEGLTLGRWVGGYAAANLPGLSEHAAVEALIDAMRANGDYDDGPDGPQKAENTIRNSLRDGMASAYVVTHHPKRSPAPPRDPTERTTTPKAAAPHPIVRGEAKTPPSDLKLASFDHTDAGNAERLLYLYGNLLRYCRGLGWLVWTGTHWKADGAKHPTASRLALLTMRATAATAEYLDGKDEREALHKHARQSQNAKALQNLMQVAAFIDPAVQINADALDRDPWVLNVENGLLDLRTATLRPHDPDELCTRLAPTRFDPNAQHPALTALLQVLEKDGRASFMQSIAGQALTGRSAKALYILTGPSGTAKSTTADAIAAMLGPDYAVHVDPHTLLVNPHGNNAGGPRADLVALRGARLAIAAELPNGGRLDGMLVKRITGRDPITARGVQAREMLTFTPYHTLLVHSNHDPRIDWTDDGMRARIMPVPFTERPDNPDPAIRTALLEDPTARSATLAWALLGAAAWHRDGAHDLTPPELVTRRKAEYLREQNPFSSWADDELNATGSYVDFTPTAELHASYRTWCEANGERPQSAKALGQHLAGVADALGITAEKRKHARGWSGLTLRRQRN